MWKKEFILFLFCGVVAALANMGSRWLFSRWLPFAAAICLAFGVGLFTAFVLFRQYVFHVSASGNLRREIFYFILVNLLALGQTLGISLLLANCILPEMQTFFSKEDLAHAAGVAIPVLTSYLGHKYFTFRKDGGAKK